jgi:hypothetical protein
MPTLLGSFTAGGLSRWMERGFSVKGRKPKSNWLKSHSVSLKGYEWSEVLSALESLGYDITDESRQQIIMNIENKLYKNLPKGSLDKKAVA